MTLSAAIKRIAELERQRNRARSKLSTASSIIDDLLRAYAADYEADGEAFPAKAKSFERGLRFLGKKAAAE